MNQISFHISNQKTPIVILYGYPRCGKTLTLVCLSRYLESLGHQIIPDLGFLPASDLIGRKECQQFREKIYTLNSYPYPKLWERILVSVKKQGKCICQIYDEQGGAYFNDNHQASGFIAPLARDLIDTPNKKIWILFIEPNVDVNRQEYVNNLLSLIQKTNTKDDFIVLLNKIDVLINCDTQDYRNLLQKYKFLFTGLLDNQVLLDKFRNKNPISKLWRPYNYRFVPFISGIFSVSQECGDVFCFSDDEYPRNLWNQIAKCLER